MKIHQITRDRLDFQQPVNEKQLEIELSKSLVGEKIVEARELDAGLFNSTFQIDTSVSSYILKVAPSSRAGVFFNEQFLMRREHSISSQLQSVSPLIPQYLSFFKVDDRDAFLQSFIEGRLWHDEIDHLATFENNLLWHQLGSFAKQLHSCHGDRFGYPAPGPNCKQWSDFIFENVNGLVKDCRRLGLYCDEVDVYCRHLSQFLSELNQIQTPCLLHGDLWPRNVIIGGGGADIHIKAVIDAERAFWGDPMSDWVLLLYDLPEAFWQGYGENLLESRDAILIAIYKGMYFILNLLESTRTNERDEQSAQAARKRLSMINDELCCFLP